MSIDKILVIVFGALGIGFTYWFFLMKKDAAAVQANEEIDILVEGGYKPEVISVSKDKTIKLNFLRKDESSCLEEVVMPDFKVRKTLPLNEKTTIEITPQKTGEFQFSCGMGMFHGKIIVT